MAVPDNNTENLIDIGDLFVGDTIMYLGEPQKVTEIEHYSSIGLWWLGFEDFAGWAVSGQVHLFQSHKETS